MTGAVERSLGTTTRMSQTRRVMIGAGSVIGAVLLSGVISIADRQTLHPILVRFWDPRTRTVVEIACTPALEQSGGAAMPYMDGGARPTPHACSTASKPGIVGDRVGRYPQSPIGREP